MTQIERLTLENINLKMRLLNQQRSNIFYAICQRAGQTPGNVTLDIETGSIIIKNKEEKENEPEKN